MRMKKNIIICCDGTDNKFGRHNTNVVKLFQRLNCRIPEQKGFYDPGVGTYSPKGRVEEQMGKAFGYGLQKNIEDAYLYLMNTYHQEDKIYLFGFSRGAFTVRALAGMLNKCGLLEKGSINLIPFASQIYNTRNNSQTAAGFKKTFCRTCIPHFIGVWDTVASLGYFMGKKFFNTKLNAKINFGYQAVSIDEKRKKFPISLWDKSNSTSGQIIEQVWFPGVHSDVGGSYKETGLSDGALKWMIQKAEAAGVIFKKNWQQNIAPDPAEKNGMHESRKYFWKLWNPVQRHIPENSLIHQSVFDRIDAKIGYNPKNLPKNFTVAD